MIRGIVFLLIFFLSQIPYVFAQDEHDQASYLLKSVSLYKICLFTVWPEQKVQSEPFNIQIVGKLPKGNKISAPENKKYNGREIVIKNVRIISEIDDSEVIFIASSMENQLESILAYAKDKPILTVADTEGFAEKGVMVNFYIAQNKVKFELNKQEIIKSPLKMSPQIFAIGRNVN